MISFKTFLIEEARVGIDHLDKLAPIKFIQLVNALNKKYNGILSKDTIDITEKIDGSSLRIGIKNGRPFIESSYSGEIYDDGGYTSYVKSRGHEPSNISTGFDNILKSIKTDTKLINMLKRYGDVKVVGEVLYIPFGLQKADKVKFIKIFYDKARLGTEWTFIPFKVLDGNNNPHPKSEEILKSLYAISNNKRKYIKPTINLNSDIDIRIELSDINTNIIKKYEDLEELLKSRKSIHKQTKEQLKKEISDYQQKLAKKILSFVDKGVFGPDFEGIVLKLQDGTTLKLVTPEFKQGIFDNDIRKNK